jgi:hypothetical protein
MRGEPRSETRNDREVQRQAARATPVEPGPFDDVFELLSAVRKIDAGEALAVEGVLVVRVRGRGPIGLVVVFLRQSSGRIGQALDRAERIGDVVVVRRAVATRD